MCLMQGGEMRKIAEATKAWVAEGGRTARLAAPLMATEADHQVAAQAIVDEFVDVPDDDALLLMGHGSKLGSNQLYADLQRDLHAMGKGNFFVATVEGTPTFEDALPLVEAHGAKRVWLAPLMIVAGDHARNDLVGDDEDSWASQLQARGFATEAVLKGLGEYEAIQQLVVDHALAAQEV